MVEVHVLDSSSVTFPEGSVTGPFTVRAAKVTVAGSEFDQGIVLVQSGAAVRVLDHNPAHIVAWPYALLFFVFLGVSLVKKI